MPKKKKEEAPTYDKIYWSRESFLMAWSRAANAAKVIKNNEEEAYSLFLNSMASSLAQETGYDLKEADHSRVLKRCVSMTYHLKKAGFQAPFYPRKPKTKKETEKPWADIARTLGLATVPKPTPTAKET